MSLFHLNHEAGLKHIGDALGHDVPEAITVTDIRLAYSYDPLAKDNTGRTIGLDEAGRLNGLRHGLEHVEYLGSHAMPPQIFKPIS